jgi:hypothetical protein
MHRTFKGLVLALAVGAVWARAESTTIADFEDRTSMNKIGGFFYFFDDRTDSGSSVITTADTATRFWDTTTYVSGAQGSETAVKLGFVLGATSPKCGPACTYPAMVGMGTTFASGGTVDISGATAFAFWAKADAPIKVVFSVGTSDVTQAGGEFAKTLSIPVSWTKFTVQLPPAADLKQPSWAKQVPFNPVNAKGLGWNVSKADNPGLSAGAFYIDDLVIENWTVPVDPTALGKAARSGASHRMVPAGRFATPLFPSGLRAVDARGRLNAIHP